METNPKQFTRVGTASPREKDAPVFKVDDLGTTRRPRKTSREDEAKQMLEHTAISPLVARGLCLLFLLTIFSVPLLQLVAKVTHREPFLPDLNRSQGVVPGADDLKQFETNLEEDSVVGRRVLPEAQNALTRLGVGNENAYVGRDGWLAYRPDLNYVTGRGFLDARQLHRRSLATENGVPVQPDPVAAIVRFKNQLAQRGIRLILLPTPLKPMVEPEHFALGDASFSEPLQNPSYGEFLRQMKQNDVLVCDPTQALFRAAQRSGQDQYLRTDTHWTPAGMETAAKVLTDFLEKQAALSPGKTAYVARKASIAGKGDVGAMLKLPPSQSAALYPAQTVALDRVVDAGGQPWRPSRSDVLLMGDSFTNIYSMRGMGWGRGAGLAEQLSLRLQRPLDVIAINAGGSHATRRRLRDQLWREANRLKNTKVVVWQFAMRDLQSGDWQNIDLPGASNGAPPVDAQNTTDLKTAMNVAFKPSSLVTVNKFRRALMRKLDRAKGTDPRVVNGADGWMFYRTDIEYVGGQKFLSQTKNPQVTALLDFKRQLAQRGIRLIVMPAPSKATIYPEKLGVTGAEVPQAPQNASFGFYCKALESLGIEVYDPTGALLRHKQSAPDELLYMPTDSHWTFTGMDTTASQLADYLRPQLPALPAVGYTRRPTEVANITDIAFMLSRDAKGSKGEPADHIQQTIQQVRTPGGLQWAPSPTADVLVMGDSFINIYSHGGFWGKSAGFSEQLSYYLQRPVDIIAMDGGGINHTRRMLQTDMLQGHDRLAGKKVVIYEIAARYLVRNDWNNIELPSQKQVAAKPATPQATSSVPATSVQVRATVKARSYVPDAANTPYPDLVIAVRLTNVQFVGKSAPAGAKPQDMLVYLWGMRGNKLTATAAWKPGQTVTLSLTPWNTVEDEYGSYNRTELNDESAAKLDAYWGLTGKEENGA